MNLTQPLNSAEPDNNSYVSQNSNASADAYQPDVVYGWQLNTYTAISIVGIIGNLVVIGVILNSRKMRRSPINILIVNQSAIDFSASLFLLLVKNIRDVNGIGSWLGRELFCKFWYNDMPIWGLFLSSTYNLLGITLERHNGIVYPMSHARSCTRGKVKYFLVIPWIIGIGYNAAYLGPLGRYENGRCNQHPLWNSVEMQKAFGILILVIQYFVPLCVIIYAYARIIVCLRRSTMAPPHGRQGNDVGDGRREERMRKATMNVVKTVFLVALAFLFCWSPNQIVYTVFNFGLVAARQGTFYHFTVIAVFFNCCINPFIYCFQYDQFRRELFKTCRRRDDHSNASISSLSESGINLSRQTVCTIETD